jgi:hypothetical protein
LIRHFVQLFQASSCVAARQIINQSHLKNSDVLFYLIYAAMRHFTVTIYCTIFPPNFKAFLGDFYKKITTVAVNPL